MGKVFCSRLENVSSPDRVLTLEGTTNWTTNTQTTTPKSSHCTVIFPCLLVVGCEAPPQPTASPQQAIMDHLPWLAEKRTTCVSQKDAGATRVSGATVMVEAVILQENAWEVLDENTSTQIFNVFFC